MAIFNYSGYDLGSISAAFSSPVYILGEERELFSRTVAGIGNRS